MSRLFEEFEERKIYTTYLKKIFEPYFDILENLERREVFSLIEDYVNVINRRREYVGELVSERSEEKVEDVYEMLCSLSCLLQERIKEITSISFITESSDQESYGVMKEFEDSPIVMGIIDSDKTIKDILKNQKKRRELRKELQKRMEDIFYCNAKIVRGGKCVKLGRSNFYDDIVYVPVSAIPQILISGEYSSIVLHENLHRLFTPFEIPKAYHTSEEGFVTLTSFLFFDPSKLVTLDPIDLSRLYFSFSLSIEFYEEVIRKLKVGEYKKRRIVRNYLISPAVIYLLRENNVPYELIFTKRFLDCVDKLEEKIFGKRILDFNIERIGCPDIILNAHLSECLRDYRGVSVRDFVFKNLVPLYYPYKYNLDKLIGFSLNS